ncbi:hypothetical protein [Niastella yeongjuensis]|uniref:hypothetical protein n=1 Tax=Niastella yeongjuensis TaxID=354355 RepID=UPI0008B3A90B|nr:hypothetical protein [Niastella yeongjuensis]SEO75250.1 hypothetical protein SAMN05660816_03419 [Niastella yeongjuensis]
MLRKIKIKTLKAFDENRIPTTTRKEVNVPVSSPEQLEDIQQKILEEVSKIPGAFVGLKKKDGPVVLMQAGTSNDTGKHFAFPEINPVLIYFNLALKKIELSQVTKKSFEECPTSDFIRKYHIFVDYFEAASSGVVHLLGAVEAFYNQLLPEDFTVVIDGNEKRKNKLEYISLDIKIQTVLPQVTGKDFPAANPDAWKLILELKTLRNRLTHLKKVKAENLTDYQKLSNDLYNTDFSKYIPAIQNFFDFYEPGLIEEDNET